MNCKLPKMRILFNFSILFLLTGCSTEQIIKESFSTARNFGRQYQERNNFLALSTSTFYPNGIPENVESLPNLEDKNLLSIQKDAQRQIDLMLPTLNKFSDLMYYSNNKTAYPIKDQNIEVINADTNTVLMTPEGSIKIDVKVIQAIYRGIVIETLSSGFDELDSNPLSIMSPTNQKKALERLITIREKYLSLSPIPTVGTMRNVADARKDTNGSWQEVATETFNMSLADAGLALITWQSSDKYDDAIAFVIAHELGHRSLKHYQRREQGESAQNLELEADRFGSMLVALTRNKNVRPNNSYLISPPWAESTYSGWNTNGICLGDINYKPNGQLSFFKFGSELAGLDTIQSKNSTHPDKEIRLQNSNAVNAATYYAIHDAQDNSGSCYRYNKDFLKLVRENPKQVVIQRLSEIRDELNEAIEMAKKDSQYEDRVKNYTERSQETELYEAVYLKYISILMH